MKEWLIGIVIGAGLMFLTLCQMKTDSYEIRCIRKDMSGLVKDICQP